MATTDGKYTLRTMGFAAGAFTLLFGLLYLHVWLRINPALVYQSQSPVFLTDLAFFKSFLSRPGGIVEYLSTFFSQLNYYPWAGALVITLTAGLICLATRGLLKALGAARPGPEAWLTPAILLLLVYSRYEHNPTASGQILTALILANVYARISLRWRLLRLPAFLVVSAATYYLAGAGYVLFAVLCGILELMRNRSIVPGIFCILCAAAVPSGFAMYSFEVTQGQAYAPLLPFGKNATPTLAPPLSLPGGLHLALVVCFPLVAIWAGLARQRDAVRCAIRQRLSALWAKIRRQEFIAEELQVDSRLSPAGWTFRSLGLLIIAGVLAATVGLDRTTKTLRELHHATQNKMWKQVLEKARLLPVEVCGMYAMRDVNTALYRTGRLPYDMFAYPHRLGQDTILLTFGAPLVRQPSTARLSEVFYDLGFINESEHYAHEALELNGPSPDILKRLAKINIIKGLPAGARTFLGALSKNLLHRKWAQDYLRKLKADPVMADEEELTTAKAHMIRADYTIGAAAKGHKEQMGPLLAQALEQHLQTDKDNRKAFEHLMAYHLLTRQLDKVVVGLSRLDDFGYPDIPRHYEEAILLYAASHPETRVQLQGGGISQETADRFQNLVHILSQNRDDKQAAHKAVMASHDRSYLLYYTTGFSDSRLADAPLKPAAITGATK